MKLPFKLIVPVRMKFKHVSSFAPIFVIGEVFLSFAVFFFLFVFIKLKEEEINI